MLGTHCKHQAEIIMASTPGQGTEKDTLILNIYKQN